MGCANSKEGFKRGEGEINQPLPRSMSMPVHHPAERKGDSYHVVALTSSTYGILRMDHVKEDTMENEKHENCNASKKRDLHGYYSFRRSLNRSSEMAAKTWSEVNNLINNYTPFKSANHSKTPSQEDGQPETINTWELMEGLEDNTGSSPLVLTNVHAMKKSVDRNLDRSFSFHSVKDVEQLAKDEPKRSIWHRVTPGVKLADDSLKSFSKPKRINETGYESLMDSPENLKSSSKQKRFSETEIGWQGLMDSPGDLRRPLMDSPGDLRRSLMDSPGDFRRPSMDSPGDFRRPSMDSPGDLRRPLMDSPGDSRRPLWMQEAGDDDFHAMSPSFFDPDLISTFRKALDEVSPRDPMEPVCLPPAPPSPYEKGVSGGISKLRSSSFQARLNTFQQRINEENIPKTPKTPKKSSAKASKQKAPPGGEDKVVLYFTSLRGIRKTFEDCCAVKMILNGFRVWVDERDISMHAVFRQELHDLLGKPATVPRVFIRGKYIGGAEEIQQLHEVGELAKYMEGFPVNTSFEPCDGCGDVRFVPCPDCDGSRKVFREEGSLMVVRCLQCNENGLIRCPVCCS